ncbi:MAG: glycosyltransferase family 2 protein [Clostridium sp.]|nr:glycosyltransferase family 2 protein [Clostridium sp.]
MTHTPPPPELSIVMPCLNEERTLPACIAKARAFLERTGIRGEIVVADNGSTDGSAGIARRLADRVVNVEQRGYGHALDGGIRAARGRYVVMGDADDSYDFGALDDFVNRLRAGADMVIGNRFGGGIRRKAMPLLHRYVGNPLLSTTARLLFHNRISDYHCGLRAFSKAAYLHIRPMCGGMEFATEMIVKALQGRLRVEQTDVVLHPDGRDRPSHLRTWHDGCRHLRLMLRLYMNPFTAHNAL